MVMQVMRSKFGPALMGVFMAFISFVFIFWGIWGKSAGMGGGGANAGSVNGEPISLSDFNREYNRRLEMYKGLNLNEEQIQQFGIKKAVFEDLVSRKLMAQEADDLGITPSDSELRDSITKIPAFQTDGHFDKSKYEELLRANRLTPSGFEESVRDDLKLGALRRHLGSFVRVSETEIKQEFDVAQDRRKVKYVWLTPVAVQKGISVPTAKVDEFLKDTAKVKLAQSRYDALKDSKYKGKKFDDVKREIAHDLLASENLNDAAKITKELSGKVVEALNHTDTAEKKINDLLKAYDIKVKDSGWINRNTLYLPGVGQAPELLKDAFASNSSINTRGGGKAKIYELAGGTLVAALVESESPDPSKFTEDEKSKIREQIAYRKQNDLNESWMKGLRAHAKVEVNPQLASSSNTRPAGGPMVPDDDM